MENPKKSLLPKILQIVALVMMGIFSLTGLAAAYIVFAPDDLWKPFYLQYNYPTEVVSVDGTPMPSDPLVVTPVIDHDYVPGEGIMIDTGSQIINLTDPSGRQKYIRITVVLEFTPSEPGYFDMLEEEKSAYIATYTAEIDAKLPIIKDVIISLVSSKTFEDLYTAQGKEILRSEIISAISARLPDFPVLSVYFTEFVVD